MKLLLLSDIHGNTEILDKLDDEFKTSDAVLFAGDFAECFKTETALPVLEKLCKKHETIFSVLGNCDEPSFIETLEERGVSAEKSFTFFEGLAICGSGGGSKFTGKTPNERTEDELISDFDVLKDSQVENLILISHNPPFNTKCDAVNESLHAGSAKFSEFIKETKPLAVITGHIHEGHAIDKIDDTVIINPGSLGENGYYAVMELEKSSEKWSVKNTELKSV